jgi:hypothetical protein
LLINLSKPDKKSQSALEYMMTYGWAILIIVIVAAVLYSLGIFNPASSVSATVTGFSGFGGVTAECYGNGVLRISLGNSLGSQIDITSITTKNTATGVVATFVPNSTLDPTPYITPDGRYVFSVSNACPSSGIRYSVNVNVNYTEPDQIFQGPYSSVGTVSGTASSMDLPIAVGAFDGVSSYIALPNVSALRPTSSITYSAWVNIKYMSTNSSAAYRVQRIVQNGADGGGGWELDVDGFLGAATCAIHTSSGWDAGVNSSAMSLNTWYLFVCTYSSSSGLSSIYVNGNSAENFTVIGGAVAYGGTAAPKIGVDDIFHVGQFADGSISNVQIYDSVLSPAEVRELYVEGLGGAPIQGAGLAGWWQLNGTVEDYSGNGNNGVNGGAIFTSDYTSP